MRDHWKSLYPIAVGLFVFSLFRLAFIGLVYCASEFFGLRWSFNPEVILFSYLAPAVAGYVTGRLAKERALLLSFLLGVSLSVLRVDTFITGLLLGMPFHLLLMRCIRSFLNVFSLVGFVFQGNQLVTVALSCTLGGAFHLWRRERSPLPLILFVWIAALASIKDYSYLTLQMGMSVSGQIGLDWSGTFILGLWPLITLAVLIVIYRLRLHKKYPRSFYITSAICLIELLYLLVAR